MDMQERKLFEYFIVVALHKTKAGVPYLPEVTQQFPLKVKGDRNVELLHSKNTWFYYMNHKTHFANKDIIVLASSNNLFPEC